MSKSFEECYKTELLNELPDLWSRIEAGIKADNAEKKPAETMAFKEESQEEKKIEVKAKSKKKKTKFFVYAVPVMAACILGIIVLPIGFSLLGGDRTSVGSPAAMEGYQSAADDYMMEDAADAECAQEEPMQNAAQSVKGEYAEGGIQADALPIAEILIEVVNVEEDKVTFRIIDANAELIAEQYALTAEDGNYICTCETMGEVEVEMNLQYYAYLREVREEIYLGILMEYNE
ncbi:MAG: hypothetical protein IKY53_07950 [Lachnospiraceae bacterium]|nr:hypothetical protein [Lachnospiraceae bacterium]